MSPDYSGIPVLHFLASLLLTWIRFLNFAIIVEYFGYRECIRRLQGTHRVGTSVAGHHTYGYNNLSDTPCSVVNLPLDSLHDLESPQSIPIDNRP